MKKHKEFHALWGYIGTAIGVVSGIALVLFQQHKTAFVLSVISFLVYVYALYLWILEKHNKKYIKSLCFITILCVCIAIYLFTGLLKPLENENKLDYSQIKDSTITALTDSIKRIQPSITLAKTIESNAHEKLNLAKQYFDSKNKPVIIVSGFSLDTLAAHKKIVISFKIENTGETSTKRIYYYASANISKKRTIEDFSSDIEILNAPPLSAKKFYEGHFISHDMLDQYLIDLLKNGKIYLFLYGVVYYFDNFNNKDSTGFCVIMNPNSPKIYTFNPSHNF